VVLDGALGGLGGVELGVVGGGGLNKSVKRFRTGSPESRSVPY